MAVRKERERATICTVRWVWDVGHTAELVAQWMRCRFSSRCSSMVEQLICNQQVRGSSPFTGFLSVDKCSISAGISKPLVYLSRARWYAYRRHELLT